RTTSRSAYYEVGRERITDRHQDHRVSVRRGKRSRRDARAAARRGARRARRDACARERGRQNLGRLPPLRALLPLRTRHAAAARLEAGLRMGGGARHWQCVRRAVQPLDPHRGGRCRRLRGLPERSEAAQQSLLQHAPAGILHHADAAPRRRAARRRPGHRPPAQGPQESLRCDADAEARGSGRRVRAVGRRLRRELRRREGRGQAAAGRRRSARQPAAADRDTARPARRGRPRGASGARLLGIVMAALLGLVFAACGAGIVLSLALSPGRQAGVLGWLGCIAAAAAGAAGITALVTRGSFALALWSLPGLTTLTLRLDALSAAFVLVTGLVLFPASIYAAGELRAGALSGRERSFTVMLLALYASIVLILIAGDAVLFLLAWEVMSILCYLLVLSARSEQRVGSAYLLLAMGEAGTLAAALGLLLLALGASTVEFGALRSGAAAL